MGVVYRAVDDDLGRRVAIKRVSPNSRSKGRQLRLLREAQTMARLTHPNVVVVYDLEYTLKHARSGRILKNLAPRTYSKPACAGSISGSILNPC